MDDFKAWLKRSPFIQALLLTVVALGFQLAVTTPIYATNDDILMTGIVSGNFVTSEPSDKMLFSNILIGRVLNELYIAQPAVPWYGLYLIGTHVIAFLTFSWACLQLVPGWRTIGVLLLYLYGVETECLRHLNFTTTSYLAAQSGLLLVILRFAKPNEKTAWVNLSVGIALLVYSSLIRLDMFKMVLCLAIPTMVNVIVNSRERFIVRKSLTIILMTGFAVGGLSYVNDAVYLAESGWRDFFKLWIPLARVTDYIKLNAWQIDPQRADDILKAADWNYNDLVLMNSWCFLDEDVYTTEKIEIVGNGWRKLQLGSTGLSISGLLKAFMMLARNPFCLGCLFTAIGLRSKGSASGYWAVWATSALAFSLIGYLVLERKLPGRVYVPIIVFTVLINVILLRLGNELSELTSDKRDVRSPGMFRLLRQWGGLLIAMACFVVAHRQALQESARICAMNQRLWQDVVTIERGQYRMVIAWPNTPLDWMTPYTDLRLLSRVNFFSMAALQRTPYATSRKHELGVADPIKALFERNDVTVIADPSRISRLPRFIEEHYHQKVEFRPVLRGVSGFVMYRAFVIKSDSKKVTAL
ncbi:MAG: hypothetical protein JWM11_6827 [Planctomycetaceae bacterium]|nr:hypothetical protein [Planctomycetaceae bacterium]